MIIFSESPTVLALYAERLVREGALSAEEVEGVRVQIERRLEEAFEESRKGDQRFEPDIPLAVSEEELMEFQPAGGTSVGMDLLREVARALTTLPDGFRLHPKLRPFMARRSEFVQGQPTAIDWAHAEALAFGTLLYEGTPVRLSGQDSVRGTFSQRHLMLTDFESGSAYVPLKHVHAEQAHFEAVDSSLSEAGVLGFE